MKPVSEVIEVNFEELKALKERARQGPLGEEDYQKLEAAIEALSRLIEMIGDKDTPISSLRALLSKPTRRRRAKFLSRRAWVKLRKTVSPRRQVQARRPNPAMAAMALRHIARPVVSRFRTPG